MTDVVSSSLDAATLSAIIDRTARRSVCRAGPHEERGCHRHPRLRAGGRRLEVIDAQSGTSVARMATGVGSRDFSRAELRRQGRSGSAIASRAANARRRLGVPTDPYRFGPVLGDIDDYLIREGTHQRLWERPGRACLPSTRRCKGVSLHSGRRAPPRVAGGRRFQRVGRPPASDAQAPGHRRLGNLPAGHLQAGARCKFEVKAADGSLLPLKADPLGMKAELRPSTASRRRRRRSRWSGTTRAG